MKVYVVLRGYGHLSPQNTIRVSCVVKVESFSTVTAQERELRKLADKGVHRTRDRLTLRLSGVPIPAPPRRAENLARDDPRTYQHGHAVFSRLLFLDERLNASFDTT